MEIENQPDYDEVKIQEEKIESSDKTTHLNSQIETEEKQEQNKGPKWADTISIGGKRIFEISAEHMFHEETKPQRKSRWSEPPQRKKKVKEDVIFNPMVSFMQPAYLAITGTALPINPKVEENPPEKKQESKWGEPWEKIYSPAPYTHLPKNIPLDDLEYLMKLHRLDEIDRKYNIADYEIPDNDIRSVSPEPIYDSVGKRLNTRVQRYKDKFIREKADIIEDLLRTRPEFVSPHDYQPPKVCKKIYLPEGDTENNYSGIILGPKGSTQKALESKSNCKISIRGRGSKYKRSENEPEEPLHCLIQGDYSDDVEKGAIMIEKLLRGEEEMDEIRKNQLVQMQAIAVVLKDTCENCGEAGHRTWACPSQKVSGKKIEVHCEICKDRSHPTSDCPQKKKTLGLTMSIQQGYERFKEQLGLKPTDGLKYSNYDPQGSLNNVNFITSLNKPSVLSLTSASIQNEPANTLSASSFIKDIAPIPQKPPNMMPTVLQQAMKNNQLLSAIPLPFQKNKNNQCQVYIGDRV